MLLTKALRGVLVFYIHPRYTPLVFVCGIVVALLAYVRMRAIFGSPPEPITATVPPPASKLFLINAETCILKKAPRALRELLAHLLLPWLEAAFTCGAFLRHPKTIPPALFHPIPANLERLRRYATDFQLFLLQTVPRGA